MLQSGLWHRGNPKLITVDAPDPGKNWSVQVPTTPEGVWWRPKCIAFNFTSSAVVGNRVPRVVYGWHFEQELREHFYFATQSNAVQAAGATARYFAAEGGELSALASSLMILPHDVRVAPGHFIGSFTGSAFDVADQYTAIVLYVEEWIFEPAGQVVPNAGDGMSRADFARLTGSLERLEGILAAWQSAEATP